MSDQPNLDPLSLGNVKRFIAFRILFNARFYYPVFTILFLDFGLTLEQFAILNAVWALTIVLLEVPSGALADTIGRRNLVVLSAVIMVAEMLLIAFAPIGNTQVVFYLFLANRILSGAAEAAASGADEALAYDSLKEHGLESQWGKVLERQMRLQSMAFIVAMSLGAILYDVDKLNAGIELLGLDWQLAKSTAMRLPLFGTLALGLLAVLTTIGMRETSGTEPLGNSWATVRKSFANTLQAGSWILKTPLALVVICAGMLFDHIVRMVLTLNSEYYRQIDLPEFSFGFIGAALALLGTVMPKLGKAMAENRSKTFNYLVLCLSIGTGLWLMSRFIPFWGALPMALVYSGIFLNGFFVSHYLNQITDSRHRATVLSFKGLSFNLAYGAIGYIYATTIASLRDNPDIAALPETEKSGALFQTAFTWGPTYFVALALAVLILATIRLRFGPGTNEATR
ncbi:MFS transporter [Pelagicoccus sp. SDUM812005]|uniref:MFS transporter n=1 Tax=Pelagicoccus sp. SDUM812005 TaxID=3041257 RepID=UPI00280D1BEA|nr:MFS transporter [Pelagicoccus sp. SDUM812005]MDQ8179301.1 MFS transporter [Pelagicoccus sp. SDUM812005]